MPVTTPMATPALNQPRALLDVRLEISAVSHRVELRPLPICEPERVQALEQPIALRIARERQVIFGKKLAERAASHARKKRPFFVREGDDVEADRSCRTQGLTRSRDFEREDHSKSAVQPTAHRHAVGVGAEENRGLRARCAAIHIAHSIDLGLEPAFAHPGAEPFSRLDIGVRQRGPVDPASRLSECREGAKVAKRPVLVETVHRRSSRGLAARALFSNDPVQGGTNIASRIRTCYCVC